MFYSFSHAVSSDIHSSPCKGWAGVFISTLCLVKWLAQDDTADQCWDQTARFLVPRSFHIKFCQFAICLHISPGLCTKPQNPASLLLPLWLPPSYYRPICHGNKDYWWHGVLNRVTNHTKGLSVSQWLQTLQTLCWYRPQLLEYGWQETRGSSYTTTSVTCFMSVTYTRGEKRRKSFKQLTNFLDTVIVLRKAFLPSSIGFAPVTWGTWWILLLPSWHSVSAI